MPATSQCISPPSQGTVCLTVDEQPKLLSRERSSVKTKEISESSRTGNLAGYYIRNNAQAEHADSSTECISKEDENSIQRDEFGTINYSYYAAKGRRIRSEYTFSFLKDCVSLIDLSVNKITGLIAHLRGVKTPVRK